MRLLFPLVFIHLAHQGDQETPDDASASLPNILCGEAPKAQGIHISILQIKASNYYTTIPFLYRSLLFHRSDAEYKCSMFPDIHVLRKSHRAEVLGLDDVVPKLTCTFTVLLITL